MLLFAKNTMDLPSEFVDEILEYNTIKYKILYLNTRAEFYYSVEHCWAVLSFCCFDAV